MDYGINRMSSGAASLAQAMLGAAGVRDQATADELATLQTGRYRAAKAREADAAAALEQDRLSAIQALGGTLGPIMGSLALDPGHSENYATLLRAGQGNSAQMADALRTMAGGARETRAVDAYRRGEQDLGNFMAAVAGRTPYTPYEQDAQGSVINTATGAVDQSNPLAQGNLGAIRALAGQRDAAAGFDRARTHNEETYVPGRIRAETDAALALAAQRWGEEARDAADAANGTSPDATTAAQKQAELEAQGLPPDVARAAAYGTVRAQQSQMGLETVYIDFGQNPPRVIGRLDSNGNFAYEGDAPAPMVNPATGAAASNDPLGLR